jgi:hypothetical protein
MVFVKYSSCIDLISIFKLLVIRRQKRRKSQIAKPIRIAIVVGYMGFKF